MTHVLSLGGSIVAPEQPDIDFLTRFRDTVRTHISATGDHVVMVVGGGGPARAYQKAYREMEPDWEHPEADWIGIAATRLNAQLLAALFLEECRDPMVTDPTVVNGMSGSVLVGAGWKPGFSTDYDAVLLAEQFGADTMVNLSNVAQIYSADPKVDPNARPLERVTWAEFRKLVGDDWTPGSNLPFDPVATRKAAELGLRVIAAGGRNIENLSRILRRQSFFGTTIGPE